MTLPMFLLVLYKEMKRLITSLPIKGHQDIKQSGAAYRSIDILTYSKGGGACSDSFAWRLGQRLQVPAY